MAFKIYKKARGKKHGPYFYKNIRTKDGVKTFYLGKDREGALMKEAEVVKAYAARGSRAISKPFGFSSKIKLAIIPVIIIFALLLFALQPGYITTVTKPVMMPYVQIETQSGIPGTYDISQTVEGSYDLKVTSSPIEPDKPAPKIEIRGLESPPANIESKIDSYSGVQPEKGEINTPVASVKQELSFKDATITLPKTGPVNYIVQCEDFDFDTFSCPIWERTKIPFTETADSITFRVNSFSAYGGALINITKAEHLDSERNFVEDVYEKVKAKDDIWAAIPDGHYLRVTFEHNLTSSNDITIYVRANRTVLIDGREVPYDVYLAKKRIDEIGGLLGA